MPALPLLLDAFVQGATAEETPEKEKRVRKGTLHFLSSVFANISTVSHRGIGRLAVCDPHGYMIRRLRVVCSF